MDPATMGAAAIGSTLLSGAVGGVGAAFSSQASADAFNFKAGIAKLNSDINKQNASWAINSGGIKAANFGLKVGQEIADTKVVQAASGLDVNSGSKSAIRDTQTDVAKYSQDLIRSDAAHTAHGYEVKAASDSMEAELDRTSASNAEKAGKLGILSSVIGTASSVASKWSQASTTGMFSGGSSGPVGTFSDGGNSGGTPNWVY